MLKMVIMMMMMKKLMVKIVMRMRMMILIMIDMMMMMMMMIMRMMKMMLKILMSMMIILMTMMIMKVILLFWHLSSIIIIFSIEVNTKKKRKLTRSAAPVSHQFVLSYLHCWGLQTKKNIPPSPPGPRVHSVSGVCIVSITRARESEAV